MSAASQDHSRRGDAATPDAPANPPVELRLALSGAPVAEVGERRVEVAPPDALLLAWLALEGPTPRERLAALLWPASGELAARNALRQRLFRLRRQIGADVVAGTATLALASPVRHDLDTAEGLLGDLTAPDAPELDAWLRSRRALRRAQVREALLARIEAHEAAGEAAAALPLALRWLDAEPLSEDAHRRVIRLHYLAGDRAAALLAFDRCEQVLKHEVGTQPSAATRALLRLVETGEPEAPPQAAAGWQGAVPASVLRPPRLVGRDAELAALRAGWQGGQRLLVTGEAGIGKSRLLGTLRLDDESVAFAAARPGDALVPYASLTRLMREVLAIAPSALAALPPATQLQLAPLLPGLVPEPPERARRAPPGEAALELLRAATPPLAGLVLDDLHFADDATLELLIVLLGAPRDATTATGAPQRAARWCLGTRPPASGSKLATLVDALASAGPLQQIAVPPLGPAQLAELVDSLALPGVSGVSLAAALARRSGGNPLFALETLKLAWQHGRFDLDGGLPPTPSLGQLIGEQLGRLSPPALALARVAAIAGLDFSLELAEHVLAQGALALADPWQELESQRVLVDTGFAHDLVFEAVLAGLPAVIARALHGRIAEWLEAAGGEPARVAAHWEAAGRRERALPGLRAAAERAHRALREHERVEILRRAADIAEATGQRAAAFDCLARAVETHMNSIRDEGGFPLLDRLDALADGDAERARALGMRAWYLTQLPDHAGAVEVGSAALALAEPLGDRALAGPIRQRLATALAMLGRFDEALPHLAAVQSWAEQHLQPEDLAEFHGNFAVVLDNLGHPERAREHHHLANRHSHALADHAQRVTHLANHGVNRLNAGDVAGAMELVSQAQALATGYELQGASVAFVWLLRSQAARALGAYADALESAGQALALLEQANPARRSTVWVHRALCWLELGQHARAGQDLDAAGQAGSLPPHLAARHALLRARWCAALGRDPGTPLAEALAIAPPNGWPEVRMTIEIEAAVRLPAQEDAAAARLLEAVQAAAVARGLGGSVLAADLHLAVRLGRLDPARAVGLARGALHRAGTLAPTLRPRAEVWWCAARALAAGGEADEARHVAREGRRWLLDTAAQRVPEPFRESFLQRASGNAELLALGA